MKLLAASVVVLALAGCSSCEPAVSPDQAVYDKLVAAGCMTADPDAGVEAVAQDHAVGDHPWMNCLYAGGSVASCHARCTK